MSALRQGSDPPRVNSDLRARLPALSADAAAVLRAMFAQSRRRGFDGGSGPCWLELAPAPPCDAGQRVAVTIDGHVASLQLETTQPQAIGELDWSDYADAARLTAWTLAHEHSLARLARAFDGVLLAQGLLEGEAPRTPGQTALGFRIGTGEEWLDRGVIQADAGVLQRLLAGSVACTDPRRRAALDALPARFCIVARGPKLRAAELRALERGDVLVLGRREQVYSRLRLLPRRAGALPAWRVTWTGGALRIDADAAATMDEFRSDAMNDTVHDDKPATQAAQQDDAPPLETPTAVADPLAQLPLRVDFSLGDVDIPLAELARLAPGYVFTIADDIAHARVGVRANGQRIGHGRLVAIGDTLGVQLEGWDADGLQ